MTQTQTRQRRTQTGSSQRTLTRDRHTLYRFFDADGVLLYIGVTGDVRTRWSLHSKTKDEWERVDTIKVQHFGSRDELLAAETAAIKAEAPLWNVTHNDRPRTVAEVRELLAAGEWLTLDDVAILFGSPKKAAHGWVKRGSVLLPDHPAPCRKVSGRIEVSPDWVGTLLLEARKVRSCDYPDGVPGEFADPRHW